MSRVCRVVIDRIPLEHATVRTYQAQRHVACLSLDDGWTTLRLPALRHPGIPVGRSGARPEPRGGQDHLRGRFPRQALLFICAPTPGIYELFRRCRMIYRWPDFCYNR